MFTDVTKFTIYFHQKQIQIQTPYMSTKFSIKNYLYFRLTSKHIQVPPLGHYPARLAKRRSILILTGPVVKTGFNRSLLGDWWSVEGVDWVNKITNIQN